MHLKSILKRDCQRIKLSKWTNKCESNVASCDSQASYLLAGFELMYH